MLPIELFLTYDWSQYQSLFDGDERCGLILTDLRVIELPNRSSYPYNSFVMLETDTEPYSGQILATWHTHPRGPSNLSMDDYNLFSDLCDIHHLILTHQSVSIYKSVEGVVMNIARKKFNG